MPDADYDEFVANRQARRELREMLRKPHDWRVNRMKELPADIQWRVARLAAGGKL